MIIAFFMYNLYVWASVATNKITTILFHFHFIHYSIINLKEAPIHKTHLKNYVKRFNKCCRAEEENTQHLTDTLLPAVT